MGTYILRRSNYFFIVSLLFISLIMSVTHLKVFADTVSQTWLSQYAPSNTSVNRYVEMARDASGNVYVGADAQDQTSFLYGIVLTKYNSAGVQQWATQYTVDQTQVTISGIAVDGNGNVYVLTDEGGNNEVVKYNTNGSQQWIYTYSGGRDHVALDNSPQTISVDSNGNVYFVTGNGGLTAVKIDSTGSQAWSQTISGASYDQGVVSVLDSNGNFYVGGNTFGVTEDVVMAKYSSGGTLQWSGTYDSGGNDALNDITIDGSGNVYTTGSNDSQSAQGFPQNYLTLKFDSAGNQVWAQTYGSSGYSSGGNSVKVSSSGDVYVTGTGSNNGFVMATVKYDNSGNQQWATRYSYNAQAQGTRLFLDSNNNVYVGGSGYSSATSYDYVLVKYDSNGNQLWAQSIDKGGVDILRDMELDSANSVLVTGYSCDVNSQNCVSTTAKYSVVDITAPTVAGIPDSQPNANGWYNHNVTINWSVSDPDSPATTPSPTVASTEGLNVTYTSGQSCDPSNNCATGNLALSIDKTIPIASLPTVQNAIILISGNQTIRATASDSLSGVSGGEYFITSTNSAPAAAPGTGAAMTYANGKISASFTASGSGVHYVWMRSKDAAGNWSSFVQKSYRVVP
jgi:hypothetical protein